MIVDRYLRERFKNSNFVFAMFAIPTVICMVLVNVNFTFQDRVDDSLPWSGAVVGLLVFCIMGFIENLIREVIKLQKFICYYEYETGMVKKKFAQTIKDNKFPGDIDGEICETMKDLDPVYFRDNLLPLGWHEGPLCKK